MSPGWFSKKLGRALNAASTGVKRTRGDCSSSTISDGTGIAEGNESPSSCARRLHECSAQVSTDHIIDADHDHHQQQEQRRDSPIEVAQQMTSRPNSTSPTHAISSTMPAGAPAREVSSSHQPRENKRRCYHGERQLGYSNPSLPSYLDNSADPRDGSGYRSHSWSTHYPHHYSPYHMPYHAPPSGPGFYHAGPGYAPDEGCHHHGGYYAPPPPPPPPPPPAQPIFVPSPSRFKFTRQTSAFSSIRELDTDDAEVQYPATRTAPSPAKTSLSLPPKGTSSGYEYGQQVHGQWLHHHSLPPPPPPPPTAFTENGHEPLQLYPSHPNAHYLAHHHFVPPQAYQMTGHNLSAYSSPRNSEGYGSNARHSEYGSAMWSTMKIGTRPSNPMATLFNYVGEEYKHISPGNPPNEDYCIVTDRPCSPMSEISLDAAFEKGDPNGRNITDCVDEYPEYRGSGGEGKGEGNMEQPMETEVTTTPQSIRNPCTLHEGKQREYKGRGSQPTNEVYMDVAVTNENSNTSSKDASPRHERIHRIVSCDEKYSAMPM